MKITQLGKYFPPHFGGVETVTEMSARGLSADHDITVVCHNYHRNAHVEEVRDGYNVVRCATQLTPFKQPISLSLGYQLWKSRPDLIHFHAPNFWAMAMISLFQRRTPLIVTHHADVEGRKFIKSLLLPMYHALLRRASFVLVSSLKNAKLFQDLPRDIEHKTVAIPFGVDDANLELRPEEVRQVAELRAEWEGQVTICFLGRLIWYKGLPVLLDAFARVQGARLVIIGEGKLEQELRQQVENLGIGDRVEFMGAVTEARKRVLLHALDVLVLPSVHQTETFGLVQIEGQLCGKPVVTTDLPTAVSEITVDGETGYIVPAGDASALADALDALIASPDLRAEMGQAGRRRAKQFYVEASYMKQLRAVAERAGPAAAVPVEA